MPTRPDHPVASTTPLWIGSRLLVWQYWDRPADSNPAIGPVLAGVDLVTFDPRTSRWHRASNVGMPVTVGRPIWTGTEVIVPPSSDWYPSAGYHGTGAGARYDPRNNRWRPLSSGNSLEFVATAAVWTGRAVVFVDTGSILVVDPSGDVIEPGDGSVLDPRSGRWYPLASPPDRVANPETSLVWTGRELLVPSDLAPPAPGGIGSPGEAAGGLSLGP